MEKISKLLEIVKKILDYSILYSVIEKFNARGHVPFFQKPQKAGNECKSLAFSLKIGHKEVITSVNMPLDKGEHLTKHLREQAFRMATLLPELYLGMPIK